MIDGSSYIGDEISIDGDTINVDGTNVFSSNTRFIKKDVTISNCDSESVIRITNIGNCKVKLSAIDAIRDY